MEDSNRFINGLWIKGALSAVERLSIESFLRHGHSYRLFTYETVDNIPKGTIVEDASGILDKDKIFKIPGGFGKGSVGGGFSDLFRYNMLHKIGGWWVDTDIVCLKPFDFSSEVVIAASDEGGYGNLANGCVLKLPKESDYTRYLVSQAGNKDVTAIGYADMGPLLVQQMVVELALQEYVVPASTFCPISWRDVESQIVYSEAVFSLKRIIPRVKRHILKFKFPHFAFTKVSKNSYAVHLWNEVWRLAELDKDASYNHTCLFEKLKREYGVLGGAD
jgi:hypothetical protein